LEYNVLFNSVINFSIPQNYGIYGANTGHTQKNGAVSKVNTIDAATFFCVYPVYDFSAAQKENITTRLFVLAYLMLLFQVLLICRIEWHGNIIISKTSK
jgi:hypothetical protein